MRCSREFKVFTNINSATVDPKSFDENSFVDVNSDICVIPPNSFVLANKRLLICALIVLKSFVQHLLTYKD